MFSTRSAGSSRGSTSSRNVRRGSSALTTVSAWYSVPSARATPVARPFLVMTSVDGRLEDDLRPKPCAARARTWVKPPLPPLVEGPRPELAVVLAERVVEQHEARSLRARADLGPDDRRRREVALEDVRLEVVVEEVRRAAGQQPDGVVEGPLVHLADARAEPGQRQEFLGVVAEDVGRRHVHERLDGLADHLHVVRVLVVRVRVVLAVARDLLLVQRRGPGSSTGSRRSPSGRTWTT